MPERKILILDKKQIQQKITRMAYQIWEDNLEESELIIAGIVNSGYTLAEYLQKEVQKISGIKVTLMKISLDKDISHLKADTDLAIDACANKVVILVDDV